MAYKQDGFLTGLLTNFRKRKDFKYEAKDSKGVYNPESNTVNIKQDDKTIQMPMREYTKKALSTTPNIVADESRLVRDVGGTARPANVIEFDKQDTSSKPKKDKSKKSKVKTPKVKTPKVKTPDAKYNISKGKKGYQQIRKK